MSRDRRQLFDHLVRTYRKAFRSTPQFDKHHPMDDRISLLTRAIATGVPIRPQVRSTSNGPGEADSD